MATSLKTVKPIKTINNIINIKYKRNYGKFPE